MLISSVSDKPNKFVTRKYSAHCTRITHAYTLEALDFHSILIDKDQFPTFRKYIARYGIWTRLRYEILSDAVKRKREDDRASEQGPTPRSPGPTTRSSSTRPTSRGPRRRAWTSSRRSKRAPRLPVHRRKTVKQTVEGARGVVRSVDRSSSAPSVTTSPRGNMTSERPISVAAAAAAADARGDVDHGPVVAFFHSKRGRRLRRPRRQRQLIHFETHITSSWSHSNSQPAPAPPRRRGTVSAKDTQVAPAPGS